jgi:hypothetical protein
MFPLNTEKANPSQGGDAKSWVPLNRDRQTAEVFLFRRLYFLKGGGYFKKFCFQSVSSYHFILSEEI